MSNHFSAAYLKFPGDDARLGLTDLFGFPSPASPGRTVLIIDVNPFMAGLNAVRGNGYSPQEATAAALTVLPDVLRHDRSQPAAYPNGRHPGDDAFMARMNFLSHGQACDSGLKPHDDLLTEFPYLEPPVPWARQTRMLRGQAHGEITPGCAR